MMPSRRAFSALALGSLLSATPAAALLGQTRGEGRPRKKVLVELFTSQG